MNTESLDRPVQAFEPSAPRSRLSVLERRIVRPATPSGLAEWQATARHSVFAATTTGPTSAFTTSGVAALENLPGGVRYRLLVPDRARVVPDLAKRLDLLVRSGAEVRTMAAVPIDAVVVDGTLAVVPGENQDDLLGGIAMVRLPSLVAAVAELFERLWPTGTPLMAGRMCGAASPADREGELLSLLADGYTDESAAARLGISVRTVRRMVSDLMSRLGARSRFQAGAKAADRAWLGDRTGRTVSAEDAR